MTEKPPESSAETGSAGSREAPPGGQLPARAIDALATFLSIRPEADRREIRDAYGRFVGALRSDAYGLDTEDLAGFERRLNRLLYLVEEASMSRAVPENIRAFLQSVPERVRKLMAGQASVTEVEALKASYAQDREIRPTVETLEVLAKKADGYRIEKELVGVKQEEEETSAALEEMEGERAGDEIDPEEVARLDSEIETLRQDLEKVKKLRGRLEEQKLLQEEVMLIETGLSIYGGTFAAEEESALAHRLQAIKGGTAEALPQNVKSLELKLAGLLQRGHEGLVKSARGLESEFLKRDWQGLEYKAPENFRAELAKFFDDLVFLFKNDIWPPDKISVKDAQERQSLTPLTEGGRARLLLEKIRQANLPREEKERGRFYPNFFGLSRRRWLSLPVNPRNTVFLAKCRETLVEELVILKTKELITSADTEERTYKYQAEIGALGPHLETFLQELNTVRQEKNKPPLDFYGLKETHGAEVYSAITGLERAGVSFQEIFAVLERARAILRDLPVRKKAEKEIAESYPLFQIDIRDRLRWQEAIVRNILREADEVGFKIRSAKRETWARWAIAGILKNPPSALEEFRRQFPQEGDPGRKVWLEILSAGNSEEAERIIGSFVANTSFCQQKIKELEARARMIPHERQELEQKLGKLMSKAREHQAKVSAAGGRDLLGERAEKDRLRTEERERVRAERGEEAPGEERIGKRGRRKRGEDGFLFAEPPSSEEEWEELEKKAGRRWREAPSAGRGEVPAGLRDGLNEFKNAVLELRKLKEVRGDLSEEEGQKFDLLLLRIDNADRLKNESVFKRALRGLKRYAETAGFDEVSQQELNRRIGVLEAAEKRLKSSKLYGETDTETISAPETKEKKKKGKKGKSKKDKKKAALDETYKGREKTGKEKTAQAVRKEKQATRKGKRK